MLEILHQSECLNKNCSINLRENTGQFLKNCPSSASFGLFLSFQTNITILQQLNVKKSFQTNITILQQLNVKKSFQTNITILQHLNVKKCPSSIKCWDSNPRPL